MERVSGTGGRPAPATLCSNGLVAGPPTSSAAAVAGRTPTLLKAVGAVDRLVATWLDRHMGDVAAARAGRFEHLPWAARGASTTATTRGVPAAVGAAAISIELALCATVGTTARLAKTTARIEVLLAAGERKRLAAVATGKCGIAGHRGRLP